MIKSSYLETFTQELVKYFATDMIFYLTKKKCVSKQLSDHSLIIILLVPVFFLKHYVPSRYR